MGRSKQQIQLLIADANTLFRTGLRALLSAENDFQVVGEASDAAEALANVRLRAPDVLIMDLALLEAAGRQVAYELRQAHARMSILFLTREDGPEQLQLAMAAGARGYMLRDSSAAQLMAGVRQMVSSSDDVNSYGLSQLVPDLQALAQSNQPYTRGSVLTSREQEVMKLLAEGRTVREVASELSLSVKTVEAHKLNLMRKLDIHNRASLVEYAIQKGMIPAALAR